MGTIDYQDTGGAGPVIVLLHGVAMNASLWRHVIPLLADRHRVVAPTLPLGGHRHPMRHDADLTLHGQVRLVAEFLERLDVHDVTLVQNDVGIGLVLAGEGPERVSRLVLASTEAFDNYPPGLPGRLLLLASRVPGGLNALIQPLRFRPLRRLPMAFGWMAKRPIPHEITDGWLHPMLSQSAIRRDLEKYVRSTDRSAMIVATERLSSFQRPALVVWAAEDHVMPVAHGRRLADLLPQGRFAEIGDSYTLIPEDRPDALAKLVSDFVADASSIEAVAEYDIAGVRPLSGKGA